MELQQILSKMEADGWEISDDFKTAHGHFLQYFLETVEEALRQPLVSGELNCEHDWLVDMYDHFGFPASRFCDKCNTREAI